MCCSSMFQVLLGAGNIAANKMVSFVCRMKVLKKLYSRRRKRQ